MTYIHERMGLDCSYAGALTFLDRAGDTSVTGLLPARASLEFLGERVKKEVALTYELLHEPSCFERRIAVWWEPIGGGPYPTFAGTISFRAQSDGVLLIEIYGQYAPPLGAIGTPFDLLAGQRIASKTARYVLNRIATMMTNAERQAV